MDRRPFAPPLGQTGAPLTPTIPLPLALPRLPRPLLALATAGLAALTRLRPTLLGYQLLVRARRR